MADLVVELYGTRAGALSGTWRTFDFVPDRPLAAVVPEPSSALPSAAH
jgi:serine/threonine-protein kinase HipA